MFDRFNPDIRTPARDAEGVIEALPDGWGVDSLFVDEYNSRLIVSPGTKAVAVHINIRRRAGRRWFEVTVERRDESGAHRSWPMTILRSVELAELLEELK